LQRPTPVSRQREEGTVQLHVFAILLLRNLHQDEDGQDLAEYMLLVALIAVVVIGAISLIGSKVQDFFIHNLLVIEQAVSFAPEFLR
jgi:pilus assembly protein Flp/PilA